MSIYVLIILALAGLLAFLGCKPIVNNMVFYPDKANVIPSENLPPNVQERFIETSDKVTIHSYYIPNKPSNKLLIYFHGNAGNIGGRLGDLLQLNSMGLNVLGVSYRGYGKSEGTPSEAGIYADGKSALEYAIHSLGFELSDIIILGRSIGTTVSINIAQNAPIHKLILVTPLTSGKEQAKASGLESLALLAGKAFDNIGKIDKVACPVLIIHGTQDTVIPIEMGERLFAKANAPKRFVRIEGANHNNLSSAYQSSYWPAIREFINEPGP